MYLKHSRSFYLPMMAPDAGGSLSDDGGANLQGGEPGLLDVEGPLGALGLPGKKSTPIPFDELLKDKSTQAEFDRRIAKALETAKEKWDQEADEKIKTAMTEAERLAKMTADEKATHEREQHEKALADRESTITRRELRAATLEALSEKSLPAQLADIVDYTDADRCNQSITAIESAFAMAVQAGVEKRMQGTTPKTGAGAPPKSWRDMTLGERAALYKQDPEQARTMAAAAGEKLA